MIVSWYLKDFKGHFCDFNGKYQQFTEFIFSPRYKN
jgi:hypothetical protein